MAMNKAKSALGVLMLDLTGPTLTPLEQELLQRSSVGGLILFSRNFVSVNQLRDLILAVRECNPQLLIAVDQEGGRVQRLRTGFLTLPALKLIGQAAARDASNADLIAHTCGWAMAAEVLHYGIDFSFAPVMDLYSVQSRVIKERAFSDDPATVSRLARAYIAGMHAAGMAATGKHFPGHGSIAADSHTELPIDTRTAEQILSMDFRPFADCIDCLDAIMPAHIVYPEVDSVCAGYSSIWIQDKLRRQLGFDGVVFSDDLTMAAAHSVGEVTQRAQLALSAGCDMVLVCNDRSGAMAVADWLELNAYPANPRLASMRAQAAPEISELYTSSKWAAAQSLVRSITASDSRHDP